MIRSMAALLATVIGLLLPAAANAACEGRWINPVSDICWSCIFPITFGSFQLADSGQQDAYEQDGGLCACGNPPKFGFRLGFWEPVRVVEVTRTPYCLVTLGGLQLHPGLPARMPGARAGSAAGGGDRGSASFAFYHAHWYVNPILHWLEVLLDFDCIERAGWDLAYVSELDATWEDDQLAALLTPEMHFTANLAGVAACAADCLAATADWPRDELWWCNGCGGPLYPLVGNIAAHVSGRQSSAHLAARLAFKLHRTGAAVYTHGDRAQCSAGWLSLAQIHKRAYKMTMIHPQAQAKSAGRCCQPFGSSPEKWARGAEWPTTGEDFAYLLFRKRNCCSGALGI